MQKNKEIGELNRKRTDFVANLSHELKTPLTSIKGYTETLRDGAIRDPKRAQEFLRKIELNTERLDLLIYDILDLSRLEAVDTHLNYEEIEIDELLKSLRDQFSLRLEKKKQTLSIDNKIKKLRADRQLLEQALSNLIGNAHRYCPEAAAIEFHGKLQNLEGQSYAQFDILDNGPGIPEKDLPRIFERFYRADKSRNRAFGGTGLDLAIVKHILLSHRGKLSAQNLETGGMKFSLLFPYSPKKTERL